MNRETDNTQASDNTGFIEVEINKLRWASVELAAAKLAICPILSA